MSDVPWARHRRALVLDVCHARQWVQCVGVDTDDGEPAWEASGLDECGDVIPDRWLGTLCPTALLPDQCPRCYGTGDTHASGCMVAANLARGVPAFWTPWVMLVAPSVGTGFALYMLRTDGALVWLDRAESADAWILRARLAGLLTHPGERAPNALHVGFVALSSDGPTLAPWSKS